MRAAKVQASLRIRAVSPEPPLLAPTSSESRRTFRQKARSLAPLNGWACAVKICHDGMLEDTNLLDGAHFISVWMFSFLQYIWAPSSELVSSSILSWQIVTAHAQPFRGARVLAFCLKVPPDSLLVWASSGGSGEIAWMRRLAWTFAARIGDKYQIRLTRPIWSSINCNINQTKLAIFHQVLSKTCYFKKFSSLQVTNFKDEKMTHFYEKKQTWVNIHGLFPCHFFHKDLAHHDLEE